jgi:hypothetical protein
LDGTATETTATAKTFRRPQSLQHKLKSLEAESLAAQDHADRLRTSIAEVETNAAARLQDTFEQARAQAAATAEQVFDFPISICAVFLIEPEHYRSHESKDH